MAVPNGTSGVVGEEHQGEAVDRQRSSCSSSSSSRSQSPGSSQQGPETAEERDDALGHSQPDSSLRFRFGAGSLRGGPRTDRTSSSECIDDDAQPSIARARPFGAGRSGVNDNGTNPATSQTALNGAVPLSSEGGDSSAVDVDHPAASRPTASRPTLARAVTISALGGNSSQPLIERARTLPRKLSLAGLSKVFSPKDDSAAFSAREMSTAQSARNYESAMAKCDRLLNDILVDGRIADAVELEQLHEGLIKYKNRYIRGRLLHHAVWVSCQRNEPDAVTVRRILEARANIRSKASFIRQGNVNELEAVHIASGLGSVPVLRVLHAWVGPHHEDRVAYLNTYCNILYAQSEGSPDGETVPFYAPIHDAAYNGKKDAVLWLLENMADPSKQNVDGRTPLHFMGVSFPGNSESELEIVVKGLLRHRARLDMRAKKDGKIPLETAAADESQFPRRLLYLLAASFQMCEPREDQAVFHQYHSFFDDMHLLSFLNMDGATQLARRLLESDDHGLKRKAWADGQRFNAVDRLANLFHTAPDAAANMLELMMVKPVVQDPGRHPIRTRAGLGGFLYDRNMRCAYQADAAQHPTFTDIKWPEWRYNSNVKDMSDLSNQPEIAWHLDLVRVPIDRDERREYIDDVETKVLLVPNVLDVDIFMALARTASSSNRIFAKLSVQAIIQCAWDHLVGSALYMRLGLNTLDLIVQAEWGLSNFVDTLSVDKYESSPRCVPLHWSIVAGGLLRDIINLFWWLREHIRKHAGHVSEYNSWLDSQTADCSEIETPPSLHALWRPQNFFSKTSFLLDLALVCLKAHFLYVAFGDGAMDETQQAVLTGVILYQLGKVFYMLRLLTCGKQVTTILGAFCSGAIIEMLLVMGLFFVAVFIACLLLRRNNSLNSPSLSLYRGLLFGDGEALDYMGLSPKEHASSGVRPLIMLFATLVFNIVILNLTTAVYGSEYSRIANEAELRFQRERSKYCCELLLSLQKIRIRGPEDAWVLVACKVACVVCTAVGLLMHLPPRDHSPTQCASTFAKCLLSAVFLALGQVLLQALMLQSHWFPHRDNNREGPFEDHFLWICHKASYNEDQFASDDLDRPTVKTLIDERVGELEDTIRSDIRSLGIKLEGLENRIATSQEAGRLPAAGRGVDASNGDGEIESLRRHVDNVGRRMDASIDRLAGQIESLAQMFAATQRTDTMGDPVTD